MPKGVSAAQKKELMVAMFQESLDVLTEKEVEKRAPKKGIIASAAKDTLKEVVDDDLVMKDKVGVSWYFWSFPSDKQAKDQAQLAALRRDAANRWTDNIHEIKKVCIDKFGMEKERFEKGFEIGEKDLEYVV